METFEAVINKGCGLDVNKKTVYACVEGKEIKKQVKNFSTKKGEFIELKNWLKKEGVTHVAMKSSSTHWKSLFHLLEENFKLLLVNPRHIRFVPGVKTDVINSEWICKQLLSGSLKGGFIPEHQLRDLRDLIQYKRKLINTIFSEKREIEKLLMDANIEMSLVAKEIFGESGIKTLDKLIAGEATVEELSKLCKGRLSKKNEQIKKAQKTFPYKIFMIHVSRQLIHSTALIIENVELQIEKKTNDIEHKFGLLLPVVAKGATK